MFVASVAVSIVLAALIGFSAARKLTHRPDVVESYRRAGVPESWLNGLAVLLFIAAAGLIVGQWWALVGIAAAAGLVGYFVVAVAFHVRAKDIAHAATPVLLAVLAAAVLVLRISTL
jgi:DoxX-like family